MYPSPDLVERSQALQGWIFSAPRWVVEQLHAAPRLERLLLAEMLPPLPFVDVAPSLGVAWFPAVPKGGHGPDAALFAVTVRDAGTEGEPGEEEVLSWVAALAGCSGEDLQLSGVAVVGLPDGYQLDGRSWGAAAAVAVISYLLGAEPKVAAVVSGALAPPGPAPLWVGVEGEEAKRSAVAREAGACELRFIREAMDASAWLAEWFGEDWQRRLQESLSQSPETLVRRAMSYFNQGHHHRADQLAAVALRAGVQGVHRGLARWICGANALHRGETVDAWFALEEASNWLFAAQHKEGADPLALARVQASVGIALLDAGMAERAVEVLQDTRGGLLDCDGFVRALEPWRVSMVHVSGSLSRALLVAGDPDGALAVLTEGPSAVGLVAREAARTWGDIAEIHRRCGRLEEAQAALSEAWKRLPDVQDGERALTRRFLELYRVRAGLSEPPDVLEPATRWPWPDLGFTLERLLREEPHRIIEWVVTPGNEPTALVHRMLLAGYGARLVAETGKVPGWLREVVAPILEDEGVDDGVRGALSDLVRGVAEGWILRCPY